MNLFYQVEQKYNYFVKPLNLYPTQKNFRMLLNLCSKPSLGLPLYSGVFFALLLLIFGCTKACGQQTIAGQSSYNAMLTALYKNTVPTISTQQLATTQQQQTESSSCFLLLDTREITEYNVSHLPNAIFAGYNNDFETYASLLASTPKNQTIILYCSIGYRSERIGEKLLQNGFTNVYNLWGGLFAWANEQRPLVQASGKKTNQVHPYSNQWGIWLYGEDILKTYQPQ